MMFLKLLLFLPCKKFHLPKWPIVFISETFSGSYLLFSVNMGRRKSKTATLTNAERKKSGQNRTMIRSFRKIEPKKLEVRVKLLQKEKEQPKEKNRTYKEKYFHWSTAKNTGTLI